MKTLESNESCEHWYRWFCDNANDSATPAEKYFRPDGLVDLALYTEQCFKAGYRAATRWIPVEEELPKEKEETYLLCNVSKKNITDVPLVWCQIWTNSLNDARVWKFWNPGQQNPEPTHWMPIPELPEEK